jgi:hypothetical protein
VIRVRILKEDRPYAEDYEAWLLGWVTCEGRVMGMIAENKGDTPWMIHLSRIELWEEV